MLQSVTKCYVVLRCVTLCSFLSKRPIVSKSVVLQKWRTATKNRDWVKVLPDIIKNYNNTKHRTIKAIPEKVFNGKAKNRQDVKIVFYNIDVGDFVRIKQHKKVFNKGDYILNLVIKPMK